MAELDSEKLKLIIDQAVADRNERLLAEGKPLMLIVRPATEQKIRILLKGMEMIGFPVTKMRESILEDALIMGLNAVCKDCLSTADEARSSCSSIDKDADRVFGEMESEMRDAIKGRAKVKEAQEKCKAFGEYGPAACCSGCVSIDCSSYMMDR